MPQGLVLGSHRPAGNYPNLAAGLREVPLTSLVADSPATDSAAENRTCARHKQLPPRPFPLAEPAQVERGTPLSISGRRNHLPCSLKQG